MTTTLLTFLGRVPKQESGYRKTAYGFPDGFRSEPVAFLGWPLQTRIGAQRLVIMGTAGSMWDHLFEGDFVFGEETEEARLRLIEAVDNSAVTAELLAPLEGPLSERLGCEARLVLIPYCRDEREQVDLLRIMADHVAHDDIVDIDVTHGFRHLPMIALLAALHLRVTRKAEIRGIWYGAFDPDTGDAPVHNLTGLLRIADWVQALHTYDKDGDYGAFAPLLGPAGELLARAAFFERTSNIVKARQALSTWTSRDDRFPAGDPAANLFRAELERRVSWYRQSDRASCERDLARRYLKQGDYVRAAIFALEAVISEKAVQSGGDASNFHARESARQELVKFGSESFRKLNSLRNALAHSARRNERIEPALKDDANLQNTLEVLFRETWGPQQDQGAC
jgi:CRISPR-associated Csx2 family protein